MNQTIKILSIGNSFSVDAQAYVNLIASAGSVKVHLGNLYIGGCSLETHARNLESGKPEYEYFINNQYTGECALKTALDDYDWDYVTLQQASGLSGKPESYQPYADALADAVRNRAPKAVITWHQTWAYEADSQHPQFADYNCDREEMHLRLRDAYARVAAHMGARVVPVGDAVREARKLKRFDPERGGKPLTRDGFHLSLMLGRFLAGHVWCECFAGLDARDSRFIPRRMEYTGHTGEGDAFTPRFSPITDHDPDKEDLRALREIAHNVSLTYRKIGESF